MALFPADSDKILEVRTESVSVVIKGSGAHRDIDAETRSTVEVRAISSERLTLRVGDTDALDGQACSDACVDVAPLFFEGEHYEIIVRGNGGKSVSLWHQDEHIREKIGAVTEDDQCLISGVVSFSGKERYSQLEISCDGEKHLEIRIEVFPAGYNTTESHKRFADEIFGEIYSRVTELIQRTYGRDRVDHTIKTKPALSEADEPFNGEWTENDVLVGSFRNTEQFEINLRNNYYYAPESAFYGLKNQVRYVALYQSAKLFYPDSGIRYYGKVVKIKRVKRKKIPVALTGNNGEAFYYVFKVDEWKTLEKPILPREEGVNEPKFTNMFLLTNCTFSYELFNVFSLRDFKVLCAIKKLTEAFIDELEQEQRILIDERYSLIVRDGEFDIINADGEYLFEPFIGVEEFSRRPKYYFNMITERLR